MRDFIRILKRFVPPYKKYMVLNIVFNVLSAILNLFCFALIIPILQILFKMDEGNYTFMDWNFNAGSWESWKALPELIKNNFFWYVSDLIEVHGGSFALIMLGIFLIVATFLKVATRDQPSPPEKSLLSKVTVIVSEAYIALFLSQSISSIINRYSMKGKSVLLKMKSPFVSVWRVSVCNHPCG